MPFLVEVSQKIEEFCLVSESTMTKRILTMPFLVEVSQKIEEFCNLLFASSKQHVVARNSRISRDEACLQKLVDWFSSNDPFPKYEHLLFIASSIVAHESINCHIAYEIGVYCLSKTVGNNFDDVIF
ncbi:hypothetical protein AVEN_169575-1 [Araneus ventricosus]|nr:hypothetical protein AVEN_233406-1 [Araneus ventricosus]GBM91160.1 hypothetical protein AVEN_169575-1 [Araneus ventricosus]